LDYPFFIFQRVGLFESKFFNIGLLIFGLVFLVSLFCCGLLAGGRQKALWQNRLTILRRDKPVAASGADRLYSLSRVVCPDGFSVLSRSDDPNGINGLPPWIIAFGLLGVICTARPPFSSGLNAARSLRNPSRWMWTSCTILFWRSLAWD